MFQLYLILCCLFTFHTRGGTAFVIRSSVSDVGPGRASRLLHLGPLGHGSSFIRSSTTILHKLTAAQARRRKKRLLTTKGCVTMLRNFDLPEALIFYGMDTVIDYSKSSSSSSVRPGVTRLINEAQGLDIPTIILSENLKMDDIAKRIDQAMGDVSEFQTYHDKGMLHYRSSLEEFPVDDSAVEDDYYVPPRYVGGGIGHAPCPAALFDAVNTITIDPKGFGGSGGFGVKNWEAQRIPLPQHCVVFVCSISDQNKNDSIDRSDGSESISRDRCIASRAAGMRVMYIEDEKLACTAEDVSDGIVETLGTSESWEMVTIDDISTPGSFWINMAQPKDVNGYRINTEEFIAEFLEKRKSSYMKEESNLPSNFVNDDDLDEDEIAALLADIDPI